MGDAAMVFENLPEIPEDVLLVEIVSSLPAKALCRFKCVSKSFLSYIEGLPFSKLPITYQVLRNVEVEPDDDAQVEVEPPDDAQRSLVVVEINSGTGYATIKSDQIIPGNVTQGHICHGFNCFVINGATTYAFLYNAANRESLYLPLPVHCHRCLLSFDPSTGLYKILCWLNRTPTARPLTFHVFTVEPGAAWRQLPNPLGIRYMLEPQAYVNGQPFWIDDEVQCVCSFLPAEEIFQQFVLPDLTHFSRFGLFDFEGLLCLVGQRLQGSPTFTLMLLKDDGDWVEVVQTFTLPLAANNARRLGYWAANSSSFSSRGGEVIIAAADGYLNPFLYIYSPVRSQAGKKHIYGANVMADIESVRAYHKKPGVGFKITQDAEQPNNHPQ